MSEESEGWYSVDENRDEGAAREAGESQPEAPAGEESSGGAEEQSRRSSSRLWTPYGDPAAADEQPRGGQETEEEISEEEYRRLVEEALDKISVAELVLDFMVSMASIAYKKMGIPHEVNEKSKDLEQAHLAIDCLDALLQSLSGHVPEEVLQPLVSTLDNLKINFVKES